MGVYCCFMYCSKYYILLELITVMKKKFFSILICLLLFMPNYAYSKITIKIVEKNENFIILENNRPLIGGKNKQFKIHKKTMVTATDHCNSVSKNAYWFTGYTSGSGKQKKGLYMMDNDDMTSLKSWRHRIICSKDLQGALKLFKNEHSNYYSELELDKKPDAYFVNSLEIKKEITSIPESKDKKVINKAKVKEKSLWTVTEKKDEFEGTINRFLISSKSFPNKSLDFPYENTNAVIGVGCQPKSYFWIYINFNEVNLVGGEFIDDKSEKYNLRAKHNDQMVSISLEQQFGSKTLFVSEKYKNQFLEWLEKEEEIMVEFEHYGDGARYYKFKTTGFKTTFKKNCR